MWLNRVWTVLVLLNWHGRACGVNAFCTLCRLSPSVDLYVGAIVITILGTRTLDPREVTNFLGVTDTPVDRRQCCGPSCAPFLLLIRSLILGAGLPASCCPSPVILLSVGPRHMVGLRRSSPAVGQTLLEAEPMCWGLLTL